MITITAKDRKEVKYQYRVGTIIETLATNRLCLGNPDNVATLTLTKGLIIDQDSMVHFIADV